MPFSESSDAPTSTTRDPEETRRAILEVTTEVVWTKGESAVRVAKVARRAGVTTGAIYAHFGSREGLLAAVHTEFMQDLVGGIVSLLSQLVVTADKNPVFTEGYAHIIRESIRGEQAVRARRWAAAASRSLHETALAESLRPMEEAMVLGIAQVIAQSQADGWIDPKFDPRALSAIFFGGIIGMALTVHAFDEDPELVEKVVRAWPLIPGGFAPEVVA